tara:strand:+ start:225 stop:2636 length:2412 start_codon:yes stop_codon:yes gene_type:complete
MAVTHKKTVNFSGVAGGGQANYDWQDPSVNWITWPPTQVGATDEWEFVVASNSGIQRQTTIEVRHWDYANDNSLTDSFTITQAAAPAVPTYTSLSGTPDPANEGQVVTFTVQGTDLSAGTVPYTLSGSGINASDINGGVLSGNITMANTTGNNWEGTLQVTLTNDQTQEGTENLICSLGATDSNGVATGGFTTNVQVNDTSTQPSTVSIELQWFESTATSGNWQVSGSSVSSGTVTNETSTAIASNFDAAPGEVIQFTITGTTNGTDFTSVGGADIITISSQSASGSLVSENLVNQDSISFVYQYTVPAANETKGVTFAAETLPDAGNNQIWVTSGVDDPSTNTTTGGTGQMAYTLNNSANNPLPFEIRVKLDPDGALADTGLNPEIYFASDAAGTQATVPWFVELDSIDNNHTDADGANAEVTFTEGVVSTPGGGTPSGFTGTPAPVSPSPTPTAEQYGGSPGASPMAGPQPPAGSNNQCYIIIKHPGDPANYVSINYTGSSQVTTTQATTPPSSETFNWDNSYTQTAPAFMDWDTTTGENRQPFSWTGGTLSGGTAAQSDFNWYNWTGLQSAAVTVRNASDTGAHAGGPGVAVFNFQEDGTNPGQQGPEQNGVMFDGTEGGTSVTLVNSTPGMWVSLMASCHVAGTVMNLADGSTKLVEDLQVGDVLKSYTIPGKGEDENKDPWQTYSSQLNQWTTTPTTATVASKASSSWGSYINFNEGLTKVTSEHPVLVKSAGNDITFKQAMNVVVGDSFFVNDAWVAITSAETVTENITAYKIDVEPADVYVADGILWHNGPNIGKE